MKYPVVYILASHRNGTLYKGVTGNLIRRVWEHKENLLDGFTKKYHVHRLVYFESHGDFQSAFAREREIKTWKRLWKTKLIKQVNPTWEDLYETLF
ncbi:MAG: GIY-YIG nuclease [Verrucomicrobia bacterium RIFCSPHIGHO2_12_FULL_41_10]|nr:MAG: GIY-YIG nuclease [Verrucomicrobia bacterium RIFCSPHIGHO2_12_FULL_41_10]